MASCYTESVFCERIVYGTLHKILFYLVGTAGFEPATHGLKGQCRPIRGKQREQIAVSKTICYALALFPVAS